VTLDPGTRVVQERVAARFAEHRYAVDEKKTPEWLESQMLWFRERYGAWTCVIDNASLTPAETCVAIFEAVVKGEGPVAKERMKARRDAWEEGAWVREAADAWAAKRAKRRAA
jgi:hypothetical protein